MTVHVYPPNDVETYVAQNGRLTLEGIKLIQRIVETVNELDERITALEVTSADHEARITALEP
ncbi:MAG: hypothetical protein ACPG4X_19340 [Pikeienuella sp.]